MSENLDELKNLLPEERLRRLREIEKKDEEELEKAKELIKESEAELEEAIELQRKIPIPQMRAIDVSTLFGKQTQEDIIFSAHRFRASPTPSQVELMEPSLESIVMPAGQPTEEAVTEQPLIMPEAEMEYRVALIRYAPAEITIERIENIRNAFKYDTNITQEQKLEMVNELALVATGIRQKFSDINSNLYFPTSAGLNVLDTGYKAVKQLLDMYKG